MALSSLSSPKHYTLPVYRGSTATLLRAANQAPPANFTAQDIVYTVELDKPTYRLVIKAPLLHTKILLAVGEKMSSTVAKGLSEEVAQTGRVTKDSIVLKIAENQVKFWVQEVIRTEGPPLRAWKKARLANGVQVLKCVFSLTTAGIGLASAAASFGASSIPAIIAAWSAVAETAGFLAQIWQDVREAERAMLNQVAKIYDVYAKYQRGQKTVVPGPGRGAASPAGHSRLGAHLRSAGDSMATALHLNTVTSVQGMSLGPSVSGLQAAIANYETKIAHLAHEANVLTSVLTDLLDTTLQLAITNGPNDPLVKANQERIDQMIGDERGTKGVHRRLQGFRGPVSIMWMRAYAEAGRKIAVNMRLQLLDMLKTTPLNQLDAQQKTASLLVTIGQWLGSNHAALTAGSITAFADAIFKDDNNNISIASINEVWGEISKWGGQAKSVVDSLRRKYPKDISSDLVTDCKADYLAAAKESGSGALGVYDKVRETYAEWLPDISGYTNPASLADKALSGTLVPGSGS